MSLKNLAAVAVLPLLVLSQSAALSSYGALPTITGNGSAVRPDGKYVISSEGITGYFIPYGASISNLFIQDVHGVERDIVLGYVRWIAEALARGCVVLRVEQVR